MPVDKGSLRTYLQLWENITREFYFYKRNPCFPYHITWNVLELSLNIGKAAKNFILDCSGGGTGSGHRGCYKTF